MKSNLLYLLAVLFLLSGCCETEEFVPEQTHLLQRKLSSVSFPDGGGVINDLTYNYNEHDELIRVGGTIVGDDEVQAVHVTLAYDSKGRVSHVQKAHTHDWTLTYNDKDQLVKLIRSYKDEDPSKSTQYTYLHTYNGLNQIEKVDVYNLKNNEDVHVGIYQYIYSGGNRITINSMSPAGVVTRKQEIITDDRKLPAYVLPLNSIPIFYFAEVLSEGILTNHNITSLTVLNGVEQTLYGGSYQAQYTYNKAGYPLTCTKTFAGGSVEKTEYVYKTK